MRRRRDDDDAGLADFQAADRGDDREQHARPPAGAFVRDPLEHLQARAARTPSYSRCRTLPALVRRAHDAHERAQRPASFTAPARDPFQFRRTRSTASGSAGWPNWPAAICSV
jgi:hypothetical protein